MTSRELCRFCNRHVQMLPSGRLAHHYLVAPGLGIPCPGAPAGGTRWTCSGCSRDDMETNEHGRIPFHYIRPDGHSNVRCKGVGGLPEIAA